MIPTDNGGPEAGQLPIYHLNLWEVLKLDSALRHDHGVDSIVESLGVAEGALEAYHAQMAAPYLQQARTCVVRSCIGFLY